MKTAVVRQNQASSPRRPQLPALQVLRFGAAFAVVLHHFGSGLFGEYGLSGNPFNLGYMGVDVFFVLSGFIICYTARPELGFQDFVRRRIARVVPLYWFLTACLIALAFFVPQLLNSTSLTAESIIRSFLFLPFEKQNGLIQPLLFLGWTLCYEMLFYLVFSCCLFAKRNVAYAASAVLLAIAMAGSIWPEGGALWHFFTNSIILEFIYGMMLCEIFIRLDPKRSRWVGIPILLIVLGLAGLWAGRDLTRFIGHGLPAALIVAGFLFVRLPDSRTVAALVLLGDASYSLYLAHPYIIQPPIKILADRLGFTLTAVAGLAAIPVAMIASVLLFIFIEKPAQRWALRAMGHRGGRGSEGAPASAI